MVWKRGTQPTVFYHKTIANTTKAVLDLFNDVVIAREKENFLVEEYHVPVRFASMNVMIQKNNESVKSPPIASVYPRMGLSIRSIEVLPSNTDHLLSHVVPRDGDVFSWMYGGVEIRVFYTLAIVGNKIHELLNIVENVIPRFRKHVNIPVIETSLGIKRDLPIVLDSNIKFSYESEWAFGQDRITSNEIDFHVDMYVYPPIEDEGVIKHIDLDFYERASEDRLLSEWNWDVDPETAGKNDTHTETLSTLDENGDPIIVIQETLP